MRRRSAEVRSSGGGQGLRRRAVVLACLCAAALAGCAARPQDIQTSTEAQRRPVDQAWVDMPPGGPAILGIVERNYADSTTQEITLENHAHVSGENKLTIIMFGPVKQVTGPENLRGNQPLALLNVSREFGWFLPGVRMQVSSYYAQNRYGSFGYATGRSRGGDTCIYAWQRIRAPDLDSTLLSHQGTISIRLRLCAPRAAETDLLRVMTDFTINAYFLSPRWNPYGTAPPPPDQLGKPGATVLPSASSYDPVAPAPVSRPAARRRAPVVDTTTDDYEVPATGSRIVAPSGTVVTVPGGTATTPTVVDPALAVPLDGFPVVPPP